MVTIEIDKKTCIKCGKCVRVCPAWIFTQTASAGEIGIQNIETCISCGHCVAVCPTSSVLHSVFPAEKVHKIERELLPNSEQVMLLCKSRRSNRAFSSKPVPGELLEKILEAAHRAPTASNMQQVEFTLVTNPEKLKEIADYTIGVFSSLAKMLGNPVVKPLLKIFSPEAAAMLPQFHRLKNEYEKGNDLILRKATAVIFIHTPKNSRFGCQDANLAYQNASLMAESLGVSQFYTGFVCAALKQDNKKRLNSILNLNDDVKIQAGIALGMPSFLYPNYIDKKDIKVNRI